MKEYAELGHMKEAEVIGKAAYYIPHHPVVRKTDAGIKLRVVFDASMSTPGSNISLNSILHTGPKLQADIVHIILRFRSHEVALTTDISKMFRQILIRAEDRKYQHVLYREDSDDYVRDYELCTVTQGTASAPFLALRTIKQLADDEGQNFPLASEVLKQDTFMDDVISGSDSVETCIELRKQLTQIAKRGNFELAKWSTSHPEVLSGIDSNDMAIPISFFSNSEADSASHGVLGLNWTPASDQFSYTQVEFSEKITKRALLSNISRLFDPIGWITPVILFAKIIIQQLWISGVGWDEQVPPDIALSWRHFFDQLPLLNALKIPRMIFNSTDKRVVLIGYADGSEKGFGACIYLRVSSESGFDSNLLIAKSKVAPVKPLSIPRLELCGAELLTKIYSVAIQALKSTDYKIEQIFAVTDSTTVLSWLTTPPFKLKTYVANRVVSITDQISADHWYHCKSEFNPSDGASRGLLPQQLVNNTLWWKGPIWLKEEISNWKISSIRQNQQTEIPEMKASKKTLVIQNDPPHLDFMENFSSFIKLQRVTAWCFRFYHNAKQEVQQKKGKPSDMVSGVLTLNELNHSLNQLIKIVQHQAFQEDFDNLQKGANVSSKLASLNPFIDTQGVLRVGGRLVHSNLNYNAKHPVILPKSSHFTQILIRHYHHIYLHAGPRLLQSIITQRYWIISARNAVRSQLHKCVKCSRAAPKIQVPQMGNLPDYRVIPSRCFLKTGVDFAGPVLLKEGRRRNASAHKAYICLFICLTTKAVHLELVSDLSADAFIAAVNRFISRRGLCTDIYSDNSRNFVGAKNQLSEIILLFNTQENGEKILSKSAEREITWHNIPPYSPHMGGIWESNIKSVKYHLKRVIGEQKLTFEEFATVLTKIEAILNSRPLCALSPNVEEIDSLTPAHFLVGGPLLSIPEYDWRDEPINRLSRWQLLQQIAQHFWSRWSKEYLNTLQQRNKWKSDATLPKLAVGDLVVIKEDNAAPLLWKMGRVTDLHPGSDQIARVATLKTHAGACRRPLIKLCRLPVD